MQRCKMVAIPTLERKTRMILLSYPGRKSELLAPFESFVIGQCEVFPVPDAPCQAGRQVSEGHRG
jgi:hypothetical protein